MQLKFNELIYCVPIVFKKMFVRKTLRVSDDNVFLKIYSFITLNKFRLLKFKCVSPKFYCSVELTGLQNRIGNLLFLQSVVRIYQDVSSHPGCFSIVFSVRQAACLYRDTRFQGFR